MRNALAVLAVLVILQMSDLNPLLLVESYRHLLENHAQLFLITWFASCVYAICWAETEKKRRVTQ
jgi:hypothetical protein